MTRLTSMHLLAFVMIAATVSPTAWALRGELSMPSIATPASMPTEQCEKLIAALSKKEAKFAGGFFINSASTLRYNGDAAALSALLADLLQCPDISVSVMFAKSEALGFTDQYIVEEQAAKNRCSWTIYHLGNHFTVTVRLDSGLDLTQLSIPVLNSPR